MSQAASQAWAFYRDLAKNKKVWTIRDKEGFPAPQNSDGRRVQPFWSSLSRVQKIIKTVPAYACFEPYEISWEEFCQKWVSGLIEDNMLIGINWSGPKALGYDLEPEKVIEAVESLITEK